MATRDEARRRPTPGGSVPIRARHAAAFLLLACLRPAAPAAGQAFDHLACFKVRDALGKATYLADVVPADPSIVVPPGCKVRVPATMLCTDAAVDGVSPPPPGSGTGVRAPRVLCYALKCSPGAKPAATLDDPFGGHAVEIGAAKMLCAPVSGEAPTPTSTPVATPTPAPTTTPSTTPAPGGLFQATNPWNVRIDSLPVSAQSAAIISWLAGAGGWGSGAMQIDFSMHLLHAGPTTPFATFTQASGYYLPDCDTSFPFPLPAGGAVEGESGYACTSGGDCHLLVVDAANGRLYEMYQAHKSGSTFTGQCAMTWDLTRAYPDTLRGDQCTSTDAAGLPVSALLFNADEVAAGEIPHAIRFILPNSRMRKSVYVRPATHAGAPSSTSSNAPPYGVRFRLRADFPMVSLPNEAARVVARAMQRYGMILSDGGTIPLTAASDTYTAAKWSSLGIDSHSLGAIAVSDFEVVGLGPTIPLTYDCVRNP